MEVTIVKRLQIDNKYILKAYKYITAAIFSIKVNN